MLSLGLSGPSLKPLFPSRESKELADLARMHPTSCAANGLNPNLMVTGGPTLAGSGRWSADPAAHLATHPWLPRSGSTSMWLAGHPYGEWGTPPYLVGAWGGGRGPRRPHVILAGAPRWWLAVARMGQGQADPSSELTAAFLWLGGLATLCPGG